MFLYQLYEDNIYVITYYIKMYVIHLVPLDFDIFTVMW